MLHAQMALRDHEAEVVAARDRIAALERALADQRAESDRLRRERDDAEAALAALVSSSHCSALLLVLPCCAVESLIGVWRDGSQEGHSRKRASADEVSPRQSTLPLGPTVPTVTFVFVRYHARRSRGCGPTRSASVARRARPASGSGTLQSKYSSALCCSVRPLARCSMSGCVVVQLLARFYRDQYEKQKAHSAGSGEFTLIERTVLVPATEMFWLRWGRS